MLRYAAMVNGFDELSVTILDGLDDFDEIPICIGYELNGEKLDLPPASADDFAAVKPIYDTMPGWKTDITAIRDANELPANAKAYLERIEVEVGVPVKSIGNGPDRDQTLLR